MENHKLNTTNQDELIQNKQVPDTLIQDYESQCKVLLEIQSMIQEVKESDNINFMYNLMTGVILNNQNRPLTATSRVLVKCADCQNIKAEDFYLISGIMTGCNKPRCPLHHFMCEKRYELTDKEIYQSN
jgi:N-methylhydantoinase B/oxoprolinase/acetone carboxylase alpha subunit